MTTTTDHSSSIDRMLAIPQLFTQAKPIWTVEQVAKALNLSISTTYRYFQSLTKFEYLDEVAGMGYCLGPAFIGFDQLIRVTDPLLQIAEPVMSTLASNIGHGTLVILCQVYRKKVMCIHQKSAGPLHTAIFYERGKPMPFFRGATSKVILAHLPWRQQRKEFDHNVDELQSIGIGRDWKTFSAGLRDIRKQGYCVSRGEVDSGRMGIAAPIFNSNGRVTRSLSAVTLQKCLDSAQEDRTIASVLAAANQITLALKTAEPSSISKLQVDRDDHTRTQNT